MGQIVVCREKCVPKKNWDMPSSRDQPSSIRILAFSSFFSTNEKEQFFIECHPLTRDEAAALQTLHRSVRPEGGCGGPGPGPNGREPSGPIWWLAAPLAPAQDCRGQRRRQDRGERQGLAAALLRGGCRRDGGRQGRRGRRRKEAQRTERRGGHPGLKPRGGEYKGCSYTLEKGKKKCVLFVNKKNLSMGHGHQFYFRMNTHKRNGDLIIY